MPEPRTPVMTIVEASWEDSRGILQTAPARMENKSANGACIRVKTPIGVGSKLSVQWRWEQFSGVAKYCRSEGRDFRVGIQRDASFHPVPNPRVAKNLPPPAAVASSGVSANPAASAQVTNAVALSARVAAAKVINPEVPSRRGMEAAAIKPSAPPGFPTAPPRMAIPPQPQQVPEKRFDPEIGVLPQRRVSQPQNLDAVRAMELPTKQPAKGKEAGNERKRMERNWLGLPHWNSKQEASSASGNGNSNGAASSGEKLFAATGADAPAFQVDLLPMEDIYRAAGIMNPPKGYGIQKVVDMLHSEHIRALSREMKRAAVLMALDAAGIPIDQLQRDARVRLEALDSYEQEQKKQVEAEWARKAEENIQIEAELERATAHHKSRIARNLEAVAREKETFHGWLITKQQEMQYMAEAAELCLKSPAHETANHSPLELGKSEAKPDATPVQAHKPEVAKVDAHSASTHRPDTIKTDAVKTDVMKIDEVKAEANKTEAIKADATKIEATKTEAHHSDTIKPDAVKLDAIKADTIKPDANAQPIPDPAKLLHPEAGMAKAAAAGKPM